MMSRPAPILLGVDGGGTNTYARLARLTTADEFEVLGSGTSGPSNPNAVGMENARGAIAAAIEAAWNEAETPPQRIDAAVLGLAGGAREDVQSILTTWTREVTGATAIRVVPDIELILPTVFPNVWGIALVAGTGSIACGVTRDGYSARCGGWGYLIGDEGSGFALGSAALDAIAQALDGRGPQTELLSGIYQRFGVRDPRGIVRSVYQSAKPQQVIASLAPLVLAAAADGDQVAEAIVNQAARDLAALVANVADKLDFGPGPIQLAVAGGMLQPDSLIEEQFRGHLRRCKATFTDVQHADDPVQGALRLAAQALAAG